MFIIGILLAGFSNRVDSYIGETAGKVVTALCSALGGFGLGGLMIFIPKFLKLRRTCKKNIDGS